QRQCAIESCRRFIMEGKGLPSPLDQTRHQLLLGDDAFVEQFRQDKKPEALREVSKAHRRSVALPLAEYEQRHSDRIEAMARAYLSGAYTMSEIGVHFGVHYMTVSRAVRRFEQNSRD
ncbi:addiction module toxin RelE, partial [Nitrosomonas halophila]